MQLSTILNNERDILTITALISSVSILISTLEWIKLHEHFKDNNIYSWEVGKARSADLANGPFSGIFNFLFKYPNILFFLFFRVINIVFLYIFLNNHLVFGFLCLLLSSSSIILSLRGNEGTTGADQMSLITITTVGLCLLSSSKFIWQCGLIFISIQVAISYATSGWIRILEPTWRNGTDLLAVIRQHTYGNQYLWKFFNTHKRITSIISMMILIFECSFIICFFLPFPYIVIFLLFGIMFHFINAIIMGLNTFTWAFISNYIACFWLSEKISNILY